MKKLRETMLDLGLTPSKEWMILGLIDLFFIGFGGLFYYLQGRLLVLLYAAGFAVVVSFAYLSRYSKMIHKRNSAREEEFVHLFTYFGIYIHNGFNVYQALQAISSYASLGLKDDFQKLLAAIDEDKSPTPYIVFSRHFESLEIKEVLLSVYQMVEEGGESYIRQFEALFDRYSAERHKLSKEAHVAALGSLSVLPLVGSGITMLSLTAAIVEVMGSLYNVL
jgi:hypothetical protein